MTARGTRSLSAALALAALLALSACGDDEDATTAAAPPTTAATATAEGATTDGVERYCDLQEELDRAVDDAFRELGENASQEEAQAALSAFVEANEDKIAELERAAPPEISEDVALLAADARARAGLTDESPAAAAEIQAAEGRVEEFEGEAGCVD